MKKPNKNIRSRLKKLAIFIVAAALAEYLVLTKLGSTPMLMVKVQMLIGLGVMVYLLYTGYKIWQEANSPFSENGMSKKKLRSRTGYPK